MMANTAAPDAEAGFAALGIDPRLVATLTALGYEEPTPVQREAIPPLLEGRDLVGQAATGTGKTAAFALPLLQRLSAAKDRAKPAALILVPTRELAMQVAEAVHRYSRGLGNHVVPIYGGQAYGQQIRALKRGADVVVATPGRALDHIRRETLKLAGVTAVVLDEADEMLDMGFVEDIETILAETPAGRQVVLFSATLPPRIVAIAKRHLRDSVQIKIARERVAAGAAPRVRQTAYIISRAQKLAALGRVLDLENPTAAILFCRTRTEVDQLAETLTARGQRAESLHGGMNQDQRDRVMRRLRSGQADLVVATDVAARGLDIEQLSHVINYDVPPTAEAYVHRIGRVGRAGREGVAITLAEPREHWLLRNIEKVTRQKIEFAQVPTVTDLRARRLEVTRVALREAILGGILDHFRVVVEPLAAEFDVMDVALGAVKLAYGAGGAEASEAEDIPIPPTRRERPGRNGGEPERAGTKKRRPSTGMARLFIGAGRNAGVSPRDLVGVIANEAGVPGRDIGVVDIADRFSIVEVPEDVADYVVDSLQGARLKGKKVTVRWDRRSDGKR